MGELAENVLAEDLRVQQLVDDLLLLARADEHMLGFARPPGRSRRHRLRRGASPAGHDPLTIDTHAVSAGRVAATCRALGTSSATSRRTRRATPRPQSSFALEQGDEFGDVDSRRRRVRHCRPSNGRVYSSASSGSTTPAAAGRGRERAGARDRGRAGSGPPGHRPDRGKPAGRRPRRPAVSGLQRRISMRRAHWGRPRREPHAAQDEDHRRRAPSQIAVIGLGTGVAVARQWR